MTNSRFTRSALFNHSLRVLGLCTSIALLSACGNSGEDAAEATVTIKRDTYGVPHVYADTVKGLFHGFGYAVAEDRLFQMEMAKRSVLGTVAEVLGAGTTVAGANHGTRDQAARALYDPEAIKAQIAKLSQEDRDIFEGYANGFNARIKEVMLNKATLMPKQFNDFGFEPSTWTGFDVAMIWVGTMAGRYSNSSSEISNLALRDNLIAAKGSVAGAKMFDQLRWLEDPTAPTTAPRANGTTPIATELLARGAKSVRGQAQFAHLAPVSKEVLNAPSALVAAWNGVVNPADRPVASNLWIVSPQKTTDGSAILNNGPQFGWVNPSYVFAIGLHGAGFDVTGNTPFAHPVVLFGTNKKIAWGATAGPLDVNDIYQEKLDPNNPQAYMFNGVSRPMTKRTEVVKVKGAADITFDVLYTVHGRVTAIDISKGSAYSFKRSWDGYEIESMVGWIRSMQATNWKDWMAQASRIAITINLYYTDAEGNIGYVSPGRLPIRPATQDIRLPALGDGSMEWLGIRPFSENPMAYNPAQGYIANWNNQSAPGVQTDGGNYSVVDRVNEFNLRIEAKPKLTPDEVKDLNRLTALADTNARYFVSSIVASAKNLAPNDPVFKAAQTLAAWNGLNTNPTDAATYSEPAATIMRTWLPLIYKSVLSDDLPASVFTTYSTGGYPGATALGSIRPGEGSKLLYNAMLGSKAGVPQTFDFFNGADKNAMVLQALTDTVNALTEKFGPDMSKWLTPVTDHQFQPNNFMGSPQAGADELLRLPTFMNRGTQNHTVTMSQSSVKLCTVAPPGQSGFVAPSGAKSKHYDDQMGLFKRFDCKPEWLTANEVEANLESSKKLAY